MYGSSQLGIYSKEEVVAIRIGVWNGTAFIPGDPPTYSINSVPAADEIFDEQVGFKNYELSNHLGNVLATVTDRKVPDIIGQTFIYFNAQITSITDYYPFGMQIEERSWTAPSNRYGFGFQGQEGDDEVSGNDGDYLSFTYRMHDARLGRFLSIDPLSDDYPWNSPYAFSENRVISAVELEGLEAHDLADGSTSYGPWSANTINAYNDFIVNNKTRWQQFDYFVNNTLLYASSEPESYIRPVETSTEPSLFEPWAQRTCINCPKGPIPLQDEASGAVFGTVEITGWWEDGTSIFDEDVGVGQPGFGESLVPIWGSGRAAISDFQNGKYISGAFNSVMAVSDVFLVKSIVTGIGKGAIKSGSNSWRATRSWYGKSRDLPKGTQVHHWLIHNNGSIGKHVPNVIKNQPWNLKPIFPKGPFNSQTVHLAIHNHSRALQFNAAQRIWHGTPTYFKALSVSYGGRGIKATIGGSD